MLNENEPEGVEESWRRVHAVGIKGPLVYTCAASTEAIQRAVSLATEEGGDAWIHGTDEVDVPGFREHIEKAKRIEALGGNVMTALRSDVCGRLDKEHPLGWASYSHVYIPISPRFGWPAVCF